jgi:hypothetical protein
MYRNPGRNVLARGTGARIGETPPEPVALEGATVVVLHMAGDASQKVAG